ncbi:hypothetical protein KUTeg_023005 [Tegillarca granosa]|uniref:PiggyBac transposable element-derived protein 4 C-terminal zinc-finger domain-containing protein n=1 Tax=Tegillarca granosa TaxID=220873 RepID=A0ABQ9E662_TEGGR|nr:hypothetical protein KUTeg_023005 [Tegillarca granosa]
MFLQTRYDYSLTAVTENDWVSYNNTLAVPSAQQNRANKSENYSKTPTHRLVHIDGVQKPCVYCRVNQNKTKSGWKTGFVGLMSVLWITWCYKPEQDQGNVRNISTIGAPHHHHIQHSPAEGSNLDDSRHRLIHVKGVRKPCVCCRLHKNRTKSGWFIYSFYKCVGCDVPLCDSRKRNCFDLYHKLLYGNQSGDGDGMTEGDNYRLFPL